MQAKEVTLNGTKTLSSLFLTKLQSSRSSLWTVTQAQGMTLLVKQRMYILPFMSNSTIITVTSNSSESFQKICLEVTALISGPCIFVATSKSNVALPSILLQ